MERTLKAKKNVTIRTNETVKEIKDISVLLGSGDEIEFGVCVWSTGNSALKFVKEMDVTLNRERISIDDRLRVLHHNDVYAIGDCAANQDNPLPMLAQVKIN